MADEVVQTPFGKFLVNPDECIGATVKAGTIWDGPGFLQVIAREHAGLGEIGATVIDIGAHLGDWAIWLAGQGAWRVIAVEPAPQKLKANLDLNKAIAADRVVVVPYAAYHTATMLAWTEPYRDQESGGAALQPTPVAGAWAVPVAEAVVAVPLDRYRLLFGRRVSLIKVDAQGADLCALKGLWHTITQDHPAIVFEWEAALARAHGHQLQDAFDWLQEVGYDVVAWPSHDHNYLAVWTGGGR